MPTAPKTPQTPQQYVGYKNGEAVWKTRREPKSLDLKIIRRITHQASSVATRNGRDRMLGGDFITAAKEIGVKESDLVKYAAAAEQHAKSLDATLASKEPPADVSAGEHVKTHSPTPWHIKNLRGETHGANGSDLPEYTFTAHGKNFDECEANARHIVKCVNAHEKLVEAMRDMLITHASAGTIAVECRNNARELLAALAGAGA